MDSNMQHHDGHDSTGRPRLMHLKDASDLEVADGNPDIRGWDLRTLDGQKIGKVEDLVVDTSLMRVRYIEGELKFDDRGSDEKRRVLIPIETARLDDDEDDVIIRLTMADTRMLPTYDGRLVPSPESDDLYAFDDSSFFGARRLGLGTTPYIAPLADGRSRYVDDKRRNDDERLDADGR